jgi:uncharacterized membrane protein YfcA
MPDSIYLFFVLLFLIAFLYASIGHGGASGYLALMAIYSFSPEVMKPTALLLNLFVSFISFIQFYRAKHFRLRIFVPLAMASIPFAYLGGMQILNTLLYKKILGLVLFIPILRFFFFKNLTAGDIRPSSNSVALVIGGLIGYLSGLIGIGGGIILSPILIFLKWTDQKQTAAISALFIFVNSLSGLAGQISNGMQFDKMMYWYVGIALIGGIFGAYYGALRFQQSVLKYILAGVLLIAALKLLLVNS